MHPSKKDIGSLSLTHGHSKLPPASGAIVPSGQGATGGGFSGVAPLAAACPFGVSLGADLTAFGCASDPLGGPTYQISPEAGSTAAVRAPAEGTGVNAQTAAPPTVTSGASSADGFSSNSPCQGPIPLTAGQCWISRCFRGRQLLGDFGEIPIASVDARRRGVRS
jgi:hypothetical protein